MTGKILYMHGHKRRFFEMNTQSIDTHAKSEQMLISLLREKNSVFLNCLKRRCMNAMFNYTTKHPFQKQHI